MSAYLTYFVENIISTDNFTFQIILYYDIPLKNMICQKFEPNSVKLSELFIDKDRNQQQALEHVVNMDKRTKRELVEYLLYDAR